MSVIKQLFLTFAVTIVIAHCWSLETGETVSVLAITRMLLPKCQRCFHIMIDQSVHGNEIFREIQQNCPIYGYNIQTAILSRHMFCALSIVVTENAEVLDELFARSQQWLIVPRVTKSILIILLGDSFLSLQAYDSYLERAGLRIVEVVVHLQNNDKGTLLGSETSVEAVDICDLLHMNNITMNSLDLISKKDQKLKVFTSKCVSPLVKPEKPVNVSLFHCPPFVIMNSKRDDVIDGLEVFLLRELNKTIPINYVFRNNVDMRWAQALKDISRGTSELAACSIWLRNFFRAEVEPTSSYCFLTTKVFVPNPKRLSQAYLLLKPFHKYTWFLWVFMLAFGVIVASAFAQSMNQIHVVRYSKFQQKFCNVEYSIWSILRISISAVPYTFPKPTESLMRFVVVSWLWISLFFGITYTTMYTTFMMKPLYSKDIKTYADMVKHNITWLNNFSLETRFLFENSNDSALQKVARSSVLENDNDRVRVMLTSKKYGIILKLLSEKYVVIDAGQDGDFMSRELHPITPSVMNHAIVFGTRKNSPYKCFVNRKIQQLTEAGILRFHLKSLLSYSLNNTDTCEHEVPLKMDHIEGIMYLFVTGLCVAFFAFIGEIMHYSLWTPKRQH